MDLDYGSKVINSKEKGVSPEERHKWRIPKLPPVPECFESIFEALIESPEAEITAIPIVRPEPFTTGNNGILYHRSKHMCNGLM
ncbi:hypothetical protein O181_069724 [Austropuccinia psidii MF-1]|uniref:Uncharacterized protein n=1 Tax=Austropuccinia psidii MF-1 TaxID=1389203 RepID=A0A9Q3EZE7_9BASI|nr:hypothetical protein [Austropuccinia psidii MF-1]